MGEIYSFQCPECGFEKQYYSGTGMPEFSEEYYPRYIPESVLPKRKYKKRSLQERIQAGYYGKEIRDLLANYNAKELEFNEDTGSPIPCYCQSCKKVRPRKPKSVVVVNNEAHSYEEYSVPQFCSSCKKELLSPEKHVVKAVCPKCGSENAGISKIGLWD